jgi:hypothetical protein
MVQASAEYAKSKARLEQTQAQAKFACIVLGRECVKHGHVPHSIAPYAAEAETLRQKHLA